MRRTKKNCVKETGASLGSTAVPWLTQASKVPKKPVQSIRKGGEGDSVQGSAG